MVSTMEKNEAERVQGGGQFQVEGGRSLLNRVVSCLHSLEAEPKPKF